MKKILSLILLCFLITACPWSPSDKERKAVIDKCIPICNKLDRPVYGIDAEVNGFGCVFDYKCLCYASKGLANPIVIVIPKKEINWD